MKSPLVAALAVAVAGLAGCGGVPTAPHPLYAPSTPTAAAITRIAVSGKTRLSFIGETTQLTAVGTFSDGSLRGITGEVLWTSSDPSVLAVSATGLVTVIRFGRAYISATSDARSAGQTIEAAPSASASTYLEIL